MSVVVYQVGEASVGSCAAGRFTIRSSCGAGRFTVRR